MTYSEKVLTEICAVADKMKMNLFEATAWYCETLKIEPSELYNSLDDFSRQRIEAAACDGRHVQKKFIKRPQNALI